MAMGRLFPGMGPARNPKGSPSSGANARDPLFDELVQAAKHASFHGWDFSWLDGRVKEPQLPWSYADLAREAMSNVERLLDIDTGGGEQLAGLGPLPAVTVATEAWGPNIAVATDRLSSLGVDVRAHQLGCRLPAVDGEFDLVLNRHGHFVPSEIARVLRPGGVFLTQQVGADNDLELNKALDAPTAARPELATLADAVAALDRLGCDVIEAYEVKPAVVFYDIGAIIYHLRAIPWQVPDFDVSRYERRLYSLYEQIRQTGSFSAHHHRFLIHARKA